MDFGRAVYSFGASYGCKGASGLIKEGIKTLGAFICRS
jgi:hypothetical protein